MDVRFTLISLQSARDLSIGAVISLSLSGSVRSKMDALGWILSYTEPEFFHIPSYFVVERFRCSLLSSRGKDLQIEQPGPCRYSPAFDFHATLAGVLSPTLVGYQVVQVRKPHQKRLLAAADGESLSS